MTHLAFQEKKEAEEKEEQAYLLWGDDGQAVESGPTFSRAKLPPSVAAPKLALPGHAESYNPSEEYLPTQEEIDKWNEMDPEDRPLNFIPKKYDSLRQVPAY